MKYLYKAMALSGFLMTLLPAFLHYYDVIAEDQMKLTMFVGTVLWFSGAIPWLGKKKMEVKP